MALQHLIVEEYEWKEEEFKEHAEKAKSLPPATKDADKLILYGLYKQAIVGSVNTSFKFETTYSGAIVKAVHSAHCLILMPDNEDEHVKPQFLKKIILLRVSAPTLDDELEKDSPFAWGSREFMRNLCIGKHVELCKHNYSFGSLELLGSVMLGGEDVTLLAISEGWAKVKKGIRLKGEARDHEAENLEDNARNKGIGLWSKEASVEGSFKYAYLRDTLARESITALKKIQGQSLEGKVVEILSGDHIIVADDSEQEYEVYLSNITCPKFGGHGVKSEAYAHEAKEFVREHLIGRQVRVELEYSRMTHTIEYYYGSVFLENEQTLAGSARDSQNVSKLVVAGGLGTVCHVVSTYYDELCSAESDSILNTKGMHSGVDPPVMVIEDYSNETWKRAGNACNYIFFHSNGKYKKLSAVVESIIITQERDKITLLIQRDKKTWKIAFSLDGVTWPRGKQRYADEAFQLLKRTILQRRVEVELRNDNPIDMDGYFVGTLLESNTHVAIPLLQAGLAELGSVYRLAYSTQLTNAQKSAKTKKLKIWENYVEPSSSNNN